MVTTTDGKKYKLSKGKVEALSSEGDTENSIVETEEVSVDSIEVVTDSIK